MKIAVIGKNKKNVEIVKRNLKLFGQEIVTKNPDIVISHGGDGSFLYSERLYPGVPKIITRDNSICHMCAQGEHVELIDKLIKKQFTIIENNKLHAVIIKKRKKIIKTAVNDIVIRNDEQYHAIRFNLFIDKSQINNEFIGDGIVVATPFGSTGYYYSITKSSFQKGIGIALNNTTTKENKYKANKKIRFKLLRNSASLSVDNDKQIIKLNEGDVVEIKQSKLKYKLIKVK